jgi:hypothetical protein
LSIQEHVTVGDGGLHELIHDRLNPFIAGRAKNVTFVKDLFEVLKPTLVVKLTKKGVVCRNLDKAAFEYFNNEFNDFMKIHMSCGPHCKHLMKFYQKIGFFKTMKLYNGKASLQIPILDFEQHYGSEIQGQGAPVSSHRGMVKKLPTGLKKGADDDAHFPF